MKCELVEGFSYNLSCSEYWAHRKTRNSYITYHVLTHTYGRIGLLEARNHFKKKKKGVNSRDLYTMKMSWRRWHEKNCILGLYVIYTYLLPDPDTDTHIWWGRDRNERRKKPGTLYHPVEGIYETGSVIWCDCHQK